MHIISEWQISSYGWNYYESGTSYFKKALITFNTQNSVDSVVCTNSNVQIIDVSVFQPKLEDTIELLQLITDCAPGTSWILYIISYFDILKKLFQEAGYPIHFVTNLYGPSESGKTSLIQTLCATSYKATFTSVRRRDKILRELLEYSGHNVLIDDYHPGESKPDQDKQNALKDSLVRYVEEFTNTPNIFITSEYLAGHFSLQDRELQIFLEKPINFELLNKLEQNKERLENIRTDFYIQVVKNEDKIVEEIKRTCSVLDQKSYSDPDAHGRSRRYMGYVMCSAWLIKKYLLRAYNIPFTPPKIEDDLELHVHIQEENIQRIRYIETRENMLLLFFEMICKGTLQLEEDWDTYIPSRENFHLRKGLYLCISHNAIIYGMQKYLKTNRHVVDEIIRELKKANLLITYENDAGNTKRHKNRHYYSIDFKGLEEYCGLPH